MTQQGFEDYLLAIYGHKNGTVNSYIMAIKILDELFQKDDVFHLQGRSIVTIKDPELLEKISVFVRDQRSLFARGEFSFFRNINPNQTSYPAKGFCSAAMKQVLDYYRYDSLEDKAWDMVRAKTEGVKVSEGLTTLFDIDKKGRDATATTCVRLGQGYFRKMVLQNFGNQCCITGLDVPEVLRASHIVPWASDEANRMNPENGLCLSATYDAAFDKHLISFDDDYRMIVSREIKDYYTKEITKTYFENFEGKQMTLPTLFLPSKELLKKHRKSMI